MALLNTNDYNDTYEWHHPNTFQVRVVITAWGQLFMHQSNFYNLFLVYDAISFM